MMDAKHEQPPKEILTRSKADGDARAGSLSESDHHVDVHRGMRRISDVYLKDLQRAVSAIFLKVLLIGCRTSVIISGIFRQDSI